MNSLIFGDFIFFKFFLNFFKFLNIFPELGHTPVHGGQTPVHGGHTPVLWTTGCPCQGYQYCKICRDWINAEENIMNPKNDLIYSM